MPTYLLAFHQKVGVNFCSVSERQAGGHSINAGRSVKKSSMSEDWGPWGCCGAEVSVAGTSPYSPLQP